MTTFFSVLNINKPKGLTSHDVIARVRRCFGLKKVGHAGTLDPMATGVLPVCLGQATRLLDYFSTTKAYRLEMTFGITTDTLDAEGQVLSDAVPTCSVTKETLVPLCEAMVGTIEQKIPVYSAKKIKGKKLYEMARQGMTVDAPSKTVTIHSIKVESVTQNAGGYPVASVVVDCGTGTFMRAIARDLGESLGCGAYLTGLIRLRHGAFDLTNSVSLETLLESDNPTQYLMSPLPYVGLPRIELVNPQLMTQLTQGQNLLQHTFVDTEPAVIAQLREQSIHNNDTCLVLQRFSGSEKTASLVIAHWKNNAMKPHKVFHNLPLAEVLVARR